MVRVPEEDTPVVIPLIIYNKSSQSCRNKIICINSQENMQPIFLYWFDGILVKVNHHALYYTWYKPTNKKPAG